MTVYIKHCVCKVRNYKRSHNTKVPYWERNQVFIDHQTCLLKSADVNLLLYPPLSIVQPKKKRQLSQKSVWVITYSMEITLFVYTIQKIPFPQSIPLSFFFGIYLVLILYIFYLYNCISVSVLTVSVQSEIVHLSHYCSINLYLSVPCICSILYLLASIHIFFTSFCSICSFFWCQN